MSIEENIQSENSYHEREKRIQDSIELRQPDRVPFAPTVSFFALRYAGYGFEEGMHDYDKLIEAVKKFTVDFQPDAFSDTYRLMSWAKTLEIMDYKQLVWPGHGGNPNATYQFVEGEYMSVEDYETFLSDTSDFLFRRFLPRAWGTLEPLQNLRPLS